jgi:hypothetical protein
MDYQGPNKVQKEDDESSEKSEKSEPQQQQPSIQPQIQGQFD